MEKQLLAACFATNKPQRGAALRSLKRGCVALLCAPLCAVARRGVARRCVARRCAALRCAALRCAALRCVVRRCAARRCAAWHSAALSVGAWHSFVRRGAALRAVVRRCAALRGVARRGVARHSAARRCAAWHSAALSVGAWHSFVRRCAPLRCAPLRGVARRGVARRCVVRHSAARHSAARHNAALSVGAWHSFVRRGLVLCGKSRTQKNRPPATNSTVSRRRKQHCRYSAPMRANQTKLIKTSGEVEAFQERKLRASLARSGATRREIEHAVDAVRQQLHDRISSDEVFRLAHRALQGARRPAAARYSLQRAIQDLGPSGFPFERFVASLWQHAGYRVRLGPKLQGKHVRHEVDIDATRGKDRILCECKFRTHSGGKVDVKTALYVYARARDLLPTGLRQFWLITNGRFTKDALAYGNGVGLRLLSWDYPRGDSLRERIDRAGLHPLTVLTTLHKAEQKRLLLKKYVLCTDLIRHPSAVNDLRLSKVREARLWAELEGLCGRELQHGREWG